jgi:hypothetical protein
VREARRHAGAARQVDELRCAALAQHAQAPARVPRHVPRQLRREPQRQAKAVARVVVALAVNRRINGQHEGRVAAGGRAAHEILGDRAVLLHVQLQPQRAVAGGAHILEQ